MVDGGGGAVSGGAVTAEPDGGICTLSGFAAAVSWPAVNLSGGGSGRPARRHATSGVNTAAAATADEYGFHVRARRTTGCPGRADAKRAVETRPG